MSERDALFHKFQPLLSKVFRQWFRSVLPEEDWAGEQYLLFCRVLTKYDPARNIPLPAYLAAMIPWQAYVQARPLWRRHKREELGLELDWIGEVSTEDTCFESVLSRLMLQSAAQTISQLPIAQRRALHGKMADEESQETAARYGCTAATVRSSLRHARNRLWKVFEEGNATQCL